LNTKKLCTLKCVQSVQNTPRNSFIETFTRAKVSY